jgi:hypothetical protein
MGGKYSTHGREERFIQNFGGKNLIERGYLEDARIDGRIILRWISRHWAGEAWTGLIWFWIGTGGGHL